MNIAVVGAGIAGKLCAKVLRQDGHDVSIFEKNARYSEAACSFVAAGLLTPLAEAANGDPAIAELGKVGLESWQQIASDIGDSDIIDLKGSISLAFKSDQSEFTDFEKKLSARGVTFKKNESDVGAEPDLEAEHLTYHVIAGEGRVDTRAYLKLLQFELEQAGVSFFFSHNIRKVGPRLIETDNGKKSFDTVIDSRGIGADSDLSDLRGVRGEVIHLRAPEVRITRPVRVLHPRNPVYIVPRANHEYVIGATSIENNDDGPITVKSTLDLLNGVYNIHHGFRYASIIQTSTGCRPAYINNLPRIDVQDGLLRINGLFRHGFLLGPLFAETVGNLIGKKVVKSAVKPYIQEVL